MRANPKSEPCLESECGDWGYRLTVTIDGLVIGKLHAVIQSETSVLLSDVKVERAVVTRRIPLRRLLSKVWPGIGTRSFRGRGIGTRMLDHFLGWCRAGGRNEVYGSVVQPDLDDTPGLLDWYRRHGFTIHPPDNRCLANAVWMVVWRNNVPHPSGASMTVGDSY